MASRGLRVGLVFGGRSVEHRVSVASARTVRRGLEAAGHRVVALGLAADGGWADRATSEAALDGKIDAIAPLGRSITHTLRRLVEAEVDLYFPIVHGTWGEDGALQGLFEMVDLPYVGTGVASSAVAMDKVLAKRQLAAVGVPVVESVDFSRRRFAAEREACLRAVATLPAPWFVKPSAGGSSVGIRKVKAPEELAAAIEGALAFDDTVLVERAVAGREIECAVLGYRELEASVLGEIVAGREFYDYEDKYLSDGATLIAPAEIVPATAERMRAMAVEAFRALGGWGMARVDLWLEGEAVYLNEINTLPGFTSISMYPRLWELSGVPLPALVDRLVGIAIERHGDRKRLDAGISRWLAEVEGR